MSESLDQFRQKDPMIDFIFKVGKELFTTPLDQRSPDYLINVGGKLTGAYAYLSQKATEARATRDTIAQQRDEEMGKLMLDYVGEGQKITVARQNAKSETIKFDKLLIKLDEEKNRWEGVLGACEKMISFIQSAIKIKQTEHFNSGKEEEVF